MSTAVNQQIQAFLTTCGAQISAAGTIAEYSQGLRDEVLNVRKDWGLTWLEECAILNLKGAAAATILQGQLSNEITRLTPRGGCFATHLNPKGKIIAEMNVLRCAQDEFDLQLRRDQKDLIANKFKLFAALDSCELKDTSDSWQIFLIAGPQAGRRLEEILGEDLHLDLLDRHALFCAWKDHPIRIVANSDLGDRAWQIWVESEAALELLQQFVADCPEQLFGNQAREVLQTERGLPLWGRDINADSLLPECGLDHAINYEKGCFVGQEIVARIHHRGQVRRRLKAFFSAEEVPAAAELKNQQGETIGHLTSCIQSPTWSCYLSLGFLNTSTPEEESRFIVERDGKAVELTRAKMPAWPTSEAEA